MQKELISVPYWRRRYSNYSAAGKATAGASAPNTVKYALVVVPNDPAMGNVTVERLIDPSPMASSSATADYASVRGAGSTGNRYRVRASASKGFRFVEFQTNLDGVGSTVQNPLEFILSKDTRIIAVFQKALNVSQPNRTAKVTWDGKMGRVNGNSLVTSPEAREGVGTVSATQGSSVTLTASPLAGYRFVKWHGAPVEGKTSTTVSFPMNSDYSIHAEFAANPSVPSSGGGGGNIGGGGSAENPENPAEEPASVRKGNGVMAFVKKWWWALLIAAFFIYKEREGGSK